MNEDIKRRWVDALRSGEYKQGNRTLKKGQEFCCLGVLCDLARQDGIGEWMDEINMDSQPVTRFVTETDRDGAALPHEVSEWAEIFTPTKPSGGLTDPADPVLKIDIEDTPVLLSCIHANDRLGLSFEEIADLIETGGVQ